MEDALLKAQMEFTPVPPDQRHSPARVRSIQARLYIDRFVEHAEALEFLSEVQQRYGEGTKTPVRALLHYQDTVITPLTKVRAAGRKIPPELQIAVREFEPQPNRRSARVKTVSARLRIDLYLEHRQAYEFLQEMQLLHGEGNKTIVRALLHYRDTVYIPLEKQRAAKRRKNGQGRS